MPMIGNDRGDFDYNAVTAINPNFGLLSGSEQNTLKHYFEVLFSADTSYIQTNADVLPAAHTGEDLSSPANQLVNVTTGPGAGSTGVTAIDVDIVGKGSIQ